MSGLSASERATMSPAQIAEAERARAADLGARRPRPRPRPRPTPSPSTSYVPTALTGAGGSDGKGVGGGNPIAGNESELEAAGKLRHWVCLNCKYIGKTTSDKLPKQHTASIADRSVGTDKRNHGKSDGGFIWQTCSCTGRCECD